MTVLPFSAPPLPPLGGDTVTFIKHLPTTDIPDAMGAFATAPTRVDVTGCRHRALPATTPSQRETPQDITDVGQQAWQTHCPVTNRDENGDLITAPLDATLNDEIEVNGIVYQIEGGIVRVTGAAGTIEFVKFLCKVQEG